jgi:hypothetical protein
MSQVSYFSPNHSSLLITGVPDVLLNLCSLLDSLALHYPHSPLLYVSISTYALHQVDGTLPEGAT